MIQTELAFQIYELKKNAWIDVHKTHNDLFIFFTSKIYAIPAMSNVAAMVFCIHSSAAIPMDYL